jgi:SAM-dependent methyltransferase
MVIENNKLFKLENLEEYKNWINNQSWYQTIHLKNGLVTPGKFQTNHRISWLNKFDFVEKSVLDIGCNSGQYCLYAKQAGAKKVVGLDINKNRIYQAKMLALNENTDVSFNVAGIEHAINYGKFDIVICIAVVTEIENVLLALKSIRDITNKTAILEMQLARPFLYASLNKSWWKKNSKISRLGRVAEIHKHKHAGWVIHPTLELVLDIFGNDFELSFFGKGLRYSRLVLNRR